MKILVSNDDGWQSTGITALYEAMGEFGEVKLVAPDRNCSAASSSLTLMNPIRAVEHKPGVFGLQGTPADCVNIALNGLFNWTPDLVVSGINHGANLGDDTLYSGTVAAALEGVLHGIPGIAFSLVGDNKDFTDTAFNDAAKVAAQIVRAFSRRGLNQDDLYNVNIPAIPFADIAGYTATRLGARKRGHNPIIERDPRGSEIYWIGPAGEPWDTAKGTDFHAIQHNQVSMSPISTDMTNHERVEQLSEILVEVAA
jgi:5'-nucleotidase